MFQSFLRFFIEKSPPATKHFWPVFVLISEASSQHAAFRKTIFWTYKPMFLFQRASKMQSAKTCLSGTNSYPVILLIGRFNLSIPPLRQTPAFILLPFTGFENTTF